MAAGRTVKSLVSRRRRTEDEGEDEEGPVLVEDSQSEGSVFSDAEDEDGDGSTVDGASAVRPETAGSAQEKTESIANGSRTKKQRKARKKASRKSKDTVVGSAQSLATFKAGADTEAMMNGLKIDDGTPAQGEVVDFETMGQDADAGAVAMPPRANGHAIAPVERQRREHEEYKKKRDSDPAFIPNRGNFFMHDTRGQMNGQGPPPARASWQSRGRGRGGASVGGPFSPANQMAQSERAAEMPWKHDLHDTINDEQPVQAPNVKPSVAPKNHDNATLKPAAPPTVPTQTRKPDFSSTKLLGTRVLRVWLPGLMKAAITISESPVKHYTRLPEHRPPLRRDKPVRVSIPGHPPKYVFPSTDRSFVFIPRQLRTNQQGYNRGYNQRSIGGYGYSSRRTSMYGGSMYSGSVAPSRRSSMAGMSREHNTFSPAGSVVGMTPSNRPMVRLPPQQHLSAYSTPVGPLSGHQTPTGMGMQMHRFPPIQDPASIVHAPSTTLHQPTPRGNKINVSVIESPILQQGPGASEPQPFANQLPANLNEYPQQPPPPYFSPRQQYQYAQPQRQQVGTPLSGIPEQVMHAPPAFQPPHAYGGQPQFYAPPYPPQQNYYYPPPPPSAGYAPMYIVPPPPPQGYMLPPPQLPPPQPSTQPSEDAANPAPSGMVAHESNGMVFYVPASEAQQQGGSVEQYQPAESFVPSYAMPGLPPPTPAPEHSYYYPGVGMQEVATAVYYPAQHGQQ